MLDEVNIVISTVWREENYLETTLAGLSSERSLSAEHPVYLVVGSPLTTHIDSYRSQPGVTIVEMGANTWSWIKNSPVTQRSSWNYYRCLTHDAADERGRLILEDDIRFARGWWQRLQTILTDLQERHSSGFILAIYSPWNQVLLERRAERFYAEYPPKWFYGTQGVFFTVAARRGFAKYLKTHGLVANERQYDLLLNDYLRQSEWPLFVATPCLIQHTGKHSISQGTWNEAQGFVEDLRSERENEHTQIE
jgi:hypothetical protein